MNNYFSRFAICAMLLLVTASPAMADTQLQLLDTLKLENKPMDVLVSGDKRFIYILTEGGKIEIYRSNGQYKDTVTVGEDINQLKAGPGNGIIYLLSRTSRNIKKVQVSLVEEIDTRDAPFMGEASAPVSVVVFSDFQCPYCARLVPVLEQVLEQNPGKVKIFFKQFPLRSHKYAFQTAQATIAAHGQGKFWEFHDLAFENYRQLNADKIEEIRSKLSLDKAQFQAKIKDPKTANQIKADIRDGQQAGVRGTPTVFISGKLQKNKTLKGLQLAIKKALRQKK